MARTRKLKRKKNRKAGQFGRWLRRTGVAARWTLRWVAPPALLIAAILGARHWVVTTEHFAMKGILVKPCKHLDVSRLLGFVDARVGSNLFTLDLAVLREKIEGHPWIKSVRITRRLPDTLLVSIEEHEPYALINLGSLYYVDETGFLFKKLEKGDRRDFPVLTGFSAVDFRDKGQAGQDKVEKLTTAVGLVDLADRIGAIDRSRISEVRYDPLTGFSLLLDPKGTQVCLGEEQFERKLQRFSAIRRHLGDRAGGLSRVDLTNPDQAVIKGFRKANTG